MRATTIITGRNKVDLLFLAELEKEIVNALTCLGCDTEKIELTLRLTLFGRCLVLVDGERFGIWDCSRKTFVD